MTSTDTEHETGEPTTRHLVRMIEVPLAAGWDGRTLDSLIVPYNRAATVSDPPRYEPYSEEFLPHAFDRQLSAPGRDKVLLNFEHEQGIRGVIGQSLTLREQDDGLHGSFGVHESADGEKALQLINSGFLTGLSAEFVPTSSRRVNGVVQRVRAHLDKVSLCRFPAYEMAQVLAVREEPDEVETETPRVPAPALDVARSEDVDARMRALGFEPLVRAETTSKRWDGAVTRFTDEQYAASVLITRTNGPGALPVREPDGTVNVNALTDAVGVLIGPRSGLPNVTLAQRAAGARRLIRYLNQFGLEVPPSLRHLATAA